MTELDRPTTRPPSERLDSWKEIARYLKRDESTVQRWEKREGMPVHRHLHDKRGSVYAFRAELDAWWQGRRQKLELAKTTDAQQLTQAEPPSKTGPTRAWWAGIAVGVGALALGISVLRSLPLPSISEKSANPELVRLTSTSGLNIDPALSPDGFSIAYASDRDGGDDLDIWVQSTGDEKPSQITNQPGDESEPSFSPDGASIVFAKPEGGGIYVVAASGGEPRLLVSVPRAHSPRFSPDGRWVTFWTGLPSWVIAVTPGATGAVFVVSADGGSPRPIVPDFVDARHPLWSPDGGKILFLGQTTPEVGLASLDWYLVDRGGGVPVRTGAVEILRRAGVNGWPIPGAWHGDDVIFSTYDEGASNVWQLSVSPSTGRVAGAAVRLTFGTAIERSPSVSSSGRIAFTSVNENVDVWRVPLDRKTGLANGALERITDNAASDRVFNVSDDGATMVFASSRTGRDEIWAKELRTGAERQITFAHRRTGRISHDGRTVAAGGGASDQPGIDLIPVAGGSVTTLCDDCMNAEWSPDDSRVLVRKGQSRLFIRERASAREWELTSHPSWPLNQTRFSPDGRWVVFHTANSPSLRQIYAVPAFGPMPVPVEAWIPVVSDFGLQADWSVDGSGIYHFSLRDGAFCAWLQPLDPQTAHPSGPPVAVKHFHQPRLRAVAGAVASNDVVDGYLYVTLTQTAANIWMLHR